MHTNPEILALRALGEEVGTASERDHLDHCPACAQEVAELSRLAGVGRSGGTSEDLLTPSPEVWQRVRAELGFTTTTADPVRETRAAQVRLPAPSAGTVSDISSGSRARTQAERRSARPTSAGRRFLALAVAAALALVVGIGVGIKYEQRLAQPRERVIARAQLNAFPKWPGSTGTAEVLADGTGKRTLVLRMATPEKIDGTTQVWLIDKETKVIKFMGPMTNGQATIDIPQDMSLFKFPFVDVSDEPPNDTNPDHSGNSIVRGQLE
jgi:hypothetical protein